MEPILEVKNLTKVYKKVPVVDNVSFSLQKGHIYGLIGPNGAGKTTIMKMLAGLTEQSSGEMSLFGKKENLDESRDRMSFMIEAPYLDGQMTARQNLEYMRYVRGVADKNRIDEVLSIVGLADVGKKQVGKFSLGMRQRLGIGMVLLSEPEIMVLDEPVNGLDPEGIVDVRHILTRLCEEEGKTILISSHLLAELSEFCTDFLLIRKGKIIEEFSAAELETKCRNHLTLRTNRLDETAAFLENELGIKEYKAVHGEELHVFEKLNELEKVSKAITDNGFVITKFVMEGENLEEYYMSKVGDENE